MAESIRSALFVDYDSIYQSIKAVNATAADRLAQRAGAWVAAIESGRLVSPKKEGGSRRRIVLKRCYADPQLLGKARTAFSASGFQMIDCAKADGRARNAADVQIALDAMDALGRAAEYDEFVLLSATADWSPVLLRLGANNRTRVIYANGTTLPAYKTLADAIVDEAPLMLLLSADEVAVSSAAETGVKKKPPEAPPDRIEIEALARKINAATSVPVFSPKTFAEFFRALSEEIADSGYHFQSTAERVAAKLTAAGRNVTRRQVVFVVKGLALKGHVFSTTDTPERLAEVFREQVLYLVGNAELTLNEREKALLPHWIVGHTTAGQTIEAVEPEREPARIQPEEAPAKAAAPSEPAKPAAEEVASRSGRRRARIARDEAFAEPAAPAPPPEPVAKPLAASKPPEPAPKPEAPKPEAAKPAEAPPPPKPPLRPAEAIKAAASRLAAGRPGGSAAPKPAPAVAKPEAPKPAQKPAAPAPAVQRPPPVAAKPAPPPAQNNEALESSILAAIAQAVDVLVEDSGATEPEALPPPPQPVAEEKPEPLPSEGGDSDDIGDEIQRIIASYSRARRQGDAP